MGAGTLTIPLSSPTTSDICSPDASVRVEEYVTDWVVLPYLQGSVEPVAPW